MAGEANGGGHMAGKVLMKSRARMREPRQLPLAAAGSGGRIGCWMRFPVPCDRACCIMLS